MSIVRITTITLISQEVADAAALSYAANAVKDFPSAEQLIGIRSEGSKLIAVSIYESQAAMDKADAERISAWLTQISSLWKVLLVK